MEKFAPLTAIACICSASAALAGNLDVPAAAPAPVVAAAVTDWAGLYAGGLVSFDSSTTGMEIFDGGVLDDGGDLSDITAFGGFVGYNIQRGSFVFGGELAVSSGEMNIPGFPDDRYGAVFDLKARAGYSFGKVMAYGVVGGSYSVFSAPAGFYPDLEYASFGLAYGAGVDYMLSEHMFVGAEYLVRDLSGAGEIDPAIEFTSTIQSIQVRVGWSF